jgi:hypothetical protein
VPKSGRPCPAEVTSVRLSAKALWQPPPFHQARDNSQEPRKLFRQLVLRLVLGFDETNELAGSWQPPPVRRYRRLSAMQARQAKSDRPPANTDAIRQCAGGDALGHSHCQIGNVTIWQPDSVATSFLDTTGCVLTIGFWESGCQARGYRPLKSPADSCCLLENKIARPPIQTPSRTSKVAK